MDSANFFRIIIYIIIYIYILYFFFVAFEVLMLLVWQGPWWLGRSPSSTKILHIDAHVIMRSPLKGILKALHRERGSTDTGWTCLGSYLTPWLATCTCTMFLSSLSWVGHEDGHLTYFDATWPPKFYASSRRSVGRHKPSLQNLAATNWVVPYQFCTKGLMPEIVAYWVYVHYVYAYWFNVLWYGSGSRSLRIRIRNAVFALRQASSHVYNMHDPFPQLAALTFDLITVAGEMQNWYHSHSLSLYTYSHCLPLPACYITTTLITPLESIFCTQHQPSPKKGVHWTWRGRYFAAKTLSNPMHLLHRGLKGWPPWGIQQPGGTKFSLSPAGPWCQQLCAIVPNLFISVFWCTTTFVLSFHVWFQCVPADLNTHSSQAQCTPPRDCMRPVQNETQRGQGERGERYGKKQNGHIW